METTKNQLVIERVFNAPVEKVWRTWTDPELFKKWWGPEHFTAPSVNIDLREGGKILAVMQAPDGTVNWSVGTYKEIVPMKKIVVTDSFADEQGNVVPATQYGLAEGFPLEMLITITFEDMGDKTKLTLVHEGIENITDEDRTNMQLGWSQSLDKLSASL